MVMICRYCNNQTNLPEDDYHNRCIPCKVDYFNTTWGGNGEIAINLNAEIKGRNYILQLRQYHPTAPARIIIGNNIINLSTVPNVTPKNIKDKLKLYLTFL